MPVKSKYEINLSSSSWSISDSSNLTSTTAISKLASTHKKSTYSSLDISFPKSNVIPSSEPKPKLIHILKGGYAKKVNDSKSVLKKTTLPVLQDKSLFKIIVAPPLIVFVIFISLFIKFYVYRNILIIC
jgi:hypothetical protein